ncbi:Na/Pi cotransporter family protein [Peptoniphilus sp. GNH]|nr:Na/Pi-cotransporter II-like protein [Clostridiales bacterium KA00134]UHR02126.1 Na/Pi cotransporter family protein [Peptoniphilus sp. GNH]
MKLSYLLGLLGGLALFLYGMDLTSQGLEMATGNKLQGLIEKFTSSRFKGLLIGTLVTAVIQSSSATTVMLVGFVNAGIMTIEQTIGIIMGANIGTTITGQIVALDIVAAAPLFCFVGFILAKFVKKNKGLKYSGQIFLGIGLLFMGMKIMSSSMSPLAEDPKFIDLMATFKNPILGIFAGTIFTSVLQSSAASLGILQATANMGLISLRASMFIICGFNIGTCITSVLSSIGASKNAQRTAACHVLFNIMGTVLFVVLAFFVPVEKYIAFMSRSVPAAQIANMHTFFNIFATVMLFPFGNKIAQISKLVISGEDAEKDEKSLIYINPNIKEPTTLFAGIRAESERMLTLVRNNFLMSVSLFHNFDQEKFDLCFHNEVIINYLNSQISKHIIENVNLPMDTSLSSLFTAYLRIVRDLERIGDHTKSIAENSQYSYNSDLPYTDEAIREFDSLESIIEDMFKSIETDIAKPHRVNDLRLAYARVENNAEIYRKLHVDRMKKGICNPESGIMFEKCLVAFERIAAYTYNVGKLSI